MLKEELFSIKIDTPNPQMYAHIKERWDHVAKPLDSMGTFETITSRIGAILEDEELDLSRKAVIVMCADNGVVEEGISQSGQEVTESVAASMGRRRSSVCKMAAGAGADVFPVDIGMNCEGTPEGVISKKITYGTKNFAKEPAMTEQQALDAIAVGMEMVKYCKEQGYRLVATGEMGIGNTTTSSAVAAALLGCDAEYVTGRGAGLDNAGLQRKIQVIQEALERYGFSKHCEGEAISDRKTAEEALRILSSVGGLDIAGLAGVFIGGAVYHMPVVLDGLISAVAALAAERLVPGAKEYMIPSHQSKEPAAQELLRMLELEPIISAQLALGEGTGAVMMFALLDIALTVYNDPAGFSEIQVEQYVRFDS